MTDHSAAQDQAAAGMRELMNTWIGNSDRVFLDRDEMQRLVDSGASDDEIRAWLQQQIDHHIEQQDMLDAHEQQ